MPFPLTAPTCSPHGAPSTGLLRYPARPQFPPGCAAEAAMGCALRSFHCAVRPPAKEDRYSRSPYTYPQSVLFQTGLYSGSKFGRRRGSKFIRREHVVPLLWRTPGRDSASSAYPGSEWSSLLPARERHRWKAQRCPLRFRLLGKPRSIAHFVFLMSGAFCTRKILVLQAEYIHTF